MSSLKVLVKEVEVFQHPNADSLDIVKVGEFQCVNRKGEYKTGNLAAFIPVQSIVPQEILKEIGLEGKLAGSDKNRLKVSKLRGEISQGLLYPAKSEWTLNQDVTEELGITKYEPPIPAQLKGQVYNLGHQYTINYDIENLYNYMDLFKNGEHLIIANSKIHGSAIQVGILPPRLVKDKCLEHDFFVASKGLGAKGLVFKNIPENQFLVYLQAAEQYGIVSKLKREFKKELNEKHLPVVLAGEVFGKGIQDLHYGYNSREKGRIGFRAFDIFIGFRNEGRFLNVAEFERHTENMGIPIMPALYKGLFNLEYLKELSNGPEVISGRKLHLREGIVIRPLIEEENSGLPMNRLQLKIVSEDYLARKKGTEHN